MKQIKRPIPKLLPKKAFSLVEVLISISIFLVATTFASSIIHNSMQKQRQAVNRSMATFLASDAIEYVKFLRDSNHLSSLRGGSNTWTDGIAQNCLNGSMCEANTVVPYAANSITECNLVGGGSQMPHGLDRCKKLRVDPARGYQYTYGPESPFVRGLTFGLVGNNLETLIVTSTVGWLDNQGTYYQVVVQENLYNW